VFFNLSLKVFFVCIVFVFVSLTSSQKFCLRVCLSSSFFSIVAKQNGILIFFVNALQFSRLSKKISEDFTNKYLKTIAGFVKQQI